MKAKNLLRILTILVLGIGLLVCLVTQPLYTSAQSVEVDPSPNVLKEHVLALTGTPDFRNFQHSHSLNAAGEYIEEVLSGYSSRTERQTFKAMSGEYFNVIASFGPKDGPRIIVGAHYDVCYEQPGADDNASGVAGLLELARLLAENEAGLEQRVDLVAFSLEEPPFFRTFEMGSHVHAKSLADAGVEVEMMLSLEMIGYFSEEKGSQDYPVGIMKLFYPTKGNYIAVVGKLGQGKPVRRVKKALKKYADIAVRSISAPASIPGIDFSDHLNYWKYDFPAVMITDTSFYRNKNYHEPTDTPETLNYEKMAEVVKGVYMAFFH